MTHETTFHIIRCTSGRCFLMITTQEFRPVDAKEKPGVENLQSCNEEITKAITQASLKNFQCIATGEYIAFQGNYHPDGIVTYKIPRKKTNHGIDKFPKEYQEEVQRLQEEYKLTKKLVTDLYKIVISLDVQTKGLERILEEIRNEASKLKDAVNKLGSGKSSSGFTPKNHRYTMFKLLSSMTFLSDKLYRRCRIDSLTIISGSFAGLP